MVQRGVTGGSGTVTDKQEIQTNNNRREYKQREMCDVEDVTQRSLNLFGGNESRAKMEEMTRKTKITDSRTMSSSEVTRPHFSTGGAKSV